VKRRIALCAAALVSILAGGAAAIMVELPLEQVAGSSSAIVRGEVVGRQSRWTPDHQKIVTDVRIQVSEVWTGEVTQATDVVVEVQGGEVPPLGMTMEDQPRFQRGRRATTPGPARSGSGAGSPTPGG
jgi:hypothetical protein